MPFGFEPVGGEQFLPALQGQGPGTDLDDAGELPAGGFAFLVGVVGQPRHFVDGVAAPGTQQPRGLRDDRVLARVILDGEHRLADDEVGAGVFESRFAGVGDDVVGPGVFLQDVLDGVAALRVGVDAPVGPRVGAQQHLGGGADAGAELHDVVVAGGFRLFQ